MHTLWALAWYQVERHAHMCAAHAESLHVDMSMEAWHGLLGVIFMRGLMQGGCGDGVRIV
eukprot:347701-Chlamydomonas_euryale.AAC.18